MEKIFPCNIRAVEEQDRPWVLEIINRYWGEDYIVVHEEVYFPDRLPGFIAWTPASEAVGLVTYQIRGDACEIITLNSLIENQGVGSKLIEAVLEEMQKKRCKRLCLTTTNDNQRAIDFYKKRGFKLHEVRKGAVDRARDIKPSIPLVSADGQPITDEWVFHLYLD